MALSLLLALNTAPALLGTQEGIRQSQSKNRREEHRARRCNLVVTCSALSTRSLELNNRLVILRNSKLYIGTGTAPQDFPDTIPSVIGHPFCGYFLPYPDSNYEGVVSTITDVAPILNWIYVDKNTYEVKYGVRDFAQPNLTGPFDCTREDRRMTFEGWEGFVVVEEAPYVWALYFDRDDDGLKSKLPPGTRILEVELSRREQRVGKPVGHEPQTLDEKMQQQKQQDEETPQQPPDATQTADKMEQQKQDEEGKPS
ncbi:hypothetical protein JX266_002796 [Neoarthrinium moseri]|nr:hypothetical protein JX266_002796 [Neoarthrinium moseri]